MSVMKWLGGQSAKPLAAGSAGRRQGYPGAHILPEAITQTVLDKRGQVLLSLCLAEHKETVAARSTAGKLVRILQRNFFKSDLRLKGVRPCGMPVHKAAG